MGSFKVWERTSALTLAVDGERRVLDNPDPSLTLSDYIRSTGNTAVKIGCGEGGCGACTVVVASWDSSRKSASYRSVNACLMPLCSCNGLSITTSMGLGNSRKGFHPLQEALAAHNGSQCGFCSPGMVMSMFGMLSAEKGDKCPDAKKIESCIDGNLCRCTGYRPILSAWQSFAGTPKDAVAGEKFAPFPDFLKDLPVEQATQAYQGSGKEWVSPASLSDLEKAMQTYKDRSDVSLVAGHTCRGIYKTDNFDYNVLVDITRIPELKAVKALDSHVEFGALTTWSQFIQTLEDVKAGGEAFSVLVEHARKVAGHSVRNLGTLGGNLAMTKSKGFASDLATILAGVSGSVTLLRAGKEEAVPLTQFFSKAYDLAGAIITKVTVPVLQAGTTFKSYRTALRPINSHALANAAFQATMKDGTITDSCLIVGALESKAFHAGPVRAEQTEAAIKGKAPSKETLAAALAEMQKECWWPEAKPEHDYEKHLLRSYLFKFFASLSGESGEKAPALGVSLSSERVATSGTQVVSWNKPEMAPIAEGMPKLTSKIQAAGEQRYTADLPEPQHTVYAAYALMGEAKEVLVDYDISAAERMPGFIGVVSAEDIPAGNVSELTTQQKLLVPKGSAAQFAKQPFLVVLADSTKHAEAAARSIIATQRPGEERPLLTVDACVARQKEADTKPLSQPVVKEGQNKVTRGDAEKTLEGAARKVTGEIFCDGQKAFYMEPPSALVIPGEDGTLTIWASCQVPSWVHGMVSGCTGIPKHKIVVNITHVGGGFGGKLTKVLHVINAAAVAAVKTGLPVRMNLNRNVDTVLCAGRAPMTAKYEVSFDDTGKLSALKARVLGDLGGADACSGFIMMIVSQNMEQIYGIKNVDIECTYCTTDKSGASAVRGPGEPQATFIMESIMEHVALELGKSAQEVREANIFTSKDDMAKVEADPLSPEMDKHSTLLALGEADIAGRTLQGFPALGIWTSLKKKVDFTSKAAAVEKFNAEHRWKKRGLAMTPVKYFVSVRNQQALVCLYSDGTCLITCDGSEIGQGLHTKVIQYAAYHLSQIVPGSTVPVADVRVGPIGTDKVAHGSLTGGSTTSEGLCDAVRDAIEKLKANLSPTLTQMQEEGKPFTFKELMGKAADKTEMQASGVCKRADFGYHCFGACVSEVEIDVLTGESNILSSSIMYDCGKSLNPTIDLGQCEGAFMMGVGFFLRERLLVDTETGHMATDGTWEYKIPSFQDVPLKFDVEFFQRPFTENGGGIASSKASGEPPLVLSSSVFCAVRQAIAAARSEFGKKGHFRLNAPATPCDIAMAIGASEEDIVKSS
eukprot:TRINITY_DN3884_c0_g1_i2.p1 TRINITY_DN3884_c0_g1~~TRINITY_DN3884_c0_g1_i2.p1  ORF type:complete len:1313 (+),score=353.87 TRINITY_DN3884_c0_g1_i2:74-4012(+)